MSERPRFDVVVSTYRRPALVEQCARSCLSQGPLLGSVIVVDDAGGDETAARLRAIGDPRLRVHVRAENGGIGAARRDGFDRSDADWTISLDSDHELLPGALEALASAVDRAGPGVGIIGARYEWDHGGVTPREIPPGPIDYAGRIAWSSRPHSIGQDYVMCLARRVRERVRWMPLRAGLVDMLFQLDAAREADALFIEERVALQRSDAPEGYTRLPTDERLARRRRDAGDGARLAAVILERHGDALARFGPPLYLQLLEQGTLFAALANRRAQVATFGARAVVASGGRPRTLALAVAGLAGGRVFELAYRLGTGGGLLRPRPAG